MRLYLPYANPKTRASFYVDSKRVSRVYGSTLVMKDGRRIKTGHAPTELGTLMERVWSVYDAPGDAL